MATKADEATEQLAEKEELHVVAKGDEDGEEALPRKLVILRYIRTAACIGSWIGMGLCAEISGPTLPYLRIRLDINYEEISRALVAKSVGFFIGTLAGGSLSQKWRQLKDLWVALSLIVAAIGTIFSPWSTNLALLSFLFALDGFGKGGIAAASSAIIIDEWKMKAAVPTHAMHFAFGIGALISPSIVKPFLPAADQVNGTCAIDSGNMTTLISSTSSPFDVYNNTNDAAIGCRPEENIEYAYLITGLFTLVYGILVGILQFFTFKIIHSSTDKNKTEDVGFSKYRIFIIALFCIVWVLPTGAERAYGKFLFAFSIESDLKFTSAEASDLMVMFWAVFSAGRLLATIVSHWVPSAALLSVELSLNLIATIILVIWSHTNHITLWVGTAIFAATLSPSFPATIAWGNEKLTLTPFLNGVVFVSAAVGDVSFSWLSGYLFEYTGPRSLMYFMVAYAAVLGALFTVLVVLLHVKPVKKLEDGSAKDDDDEKKKMAENGDSKV